MTVTIPTYDEYVATLSRLTEHVDPTTPTAEAAAIKVAAESLAALGPIDVITLEQWTRDHPQAVPVLGLTVGPVTGEVEERAEAAHRDNRMGDDGERASR